MTLHKFLFTISLFLQTASLFSTAHREPYFIVIGAQKAGTTSLFSYLAQHPKIATNRKEIHFFDRNYHKGIDWYEKIISRTKQDRIIVGEATPSYIFEPHVSRRVFRHYPNVKLILLLRNPVDRAFSAYKMRVRNGGENRSFEEVVRSELKLLKDDDPVIRRRSLKNDSIITRGIYISQIKRWMEFFPSRQMLILCAEDFFNNPRKIMKKVYRFLKVHEHDFGNFTVMNAGESNEIMSDQIRTELVEFYKPYNQKLQEYLTHEAKLNLQLGWD